MLLGSWILSTSKMNVFFLGFVFLVGEFLEVEFSLTTISTVKSQLKKKTDAKNCIRLWMKSTYSSTSAPKSGQLG